MFAVIRTGGKQYRVAEDQKIIVEKLDGDPGSTVELRDVLMIDDGKAPQVGTPVLDQAAVFAEIVEQSRADKIIVFKKNRRKGYRRRAGHRQDQTVLRITGISSDGKKPAKADAKAKPKDEAKAKPKDEAAAKPKDETKAKAKDETKGKAKETAKAAPQETVKKTATKKPAAKKAAKPQSKSESKE